VALEASPSHVVKGVAGSLHLDIESYPTKSIRSSHRSIDGDASTSDLQHYVVDSFSNDCKEPPPSYQDAVSDYEYSPIQPSDALPGDDCQPPRRYAQYRGDRKSSTINAANDEFQRRSEEGASALERRRALQATYPRNDRDVGESILVPVEPEDVLGTHQEIPSVSLRHVRVLANISVGLRESVWRQRLIENVFSTSTPE
jgi:hypothetical protein